MSACGSAGSAALPVAYDSAGVTVLSFAWEAPSAALIVADIPDFIGGGGEGTDDSPLFGIADVAWSPEHGVVAIEASTQQILIFGEDGGIRHRIGRRGWGPTESMGASQVYVLPDGTVGVFDRRRRRFLAFDVDGALVREQEIPRISLGSMDRLAPLDDGSFVLAVLGGFSPQTGAQGSYRVPSPILLIREQVDTVAVVPGKEVFTNREVVGGVIWGAETFVAGTDDGVWLGDSNTPEVRRLSHSGNLNAVVRWTSTADRAVTSRKRDALWRELSEALPEGGEAQFRELRAAMVFADTLPAYGSMVHGRNGWLWIGAHIEAPYELLNLPIPQQEWRAIDLLRQKVYALNTPEGFRVIEADSAYVLGIHTDTLGVETIRRYSLQLALRANQAHE